MEENQSKRKAIMSKSAEHKLISILDEFDSNLSKWLSSKEGKGFFESHRVSAYYWLIENSEHASLLARIWANLSIRAYK